MRACFGLLCSNELKYNHAAETAINQIKDKRYIDSLVDYVGEVVLVGINYDKRSTKHQCGIERVTKTSLCIEKKFGESSVKKFGESSVKIVELMKANKHITIPEMAKALSMSTRGVEKNIKRLQMEEVITRIGPDKGGYWKVIGENG